MPRDDDRRRSRQPSSSPQKRDRDRTRDRDRDQDHDNDRQEARERREERERRREERDRRERRRSAAAAEDTAPKRRSQNSNEEEKRHSSRQRASNSPEKRKTRTRVTERYTDSSSGGSSKALSADALARLDAINDGRAYESANDSDRDREKRRSRAQDGEQKYRSRHHAAAAAIMEEKMRNKSSKRVASGTEVEKGRGWASSENSEETIERKRNINWAAWKQKARERKWWLAAAFFALVLIIIIPVAVVESKKNNKVSGSGGAVNAPGSNPDNIGGMTPQDVPDWAKNTYYDPFTWYDTVDFNTTITNETVGGLPIMGLNSTWDDSAVANENVPALNKQFNYGKTPIRGVNVGGWLSIEPFISPSLFDQFPQSAQVVDEYTLTTKLGPSLAAQQLEKHYSSFINLTSFQEIRDAGFDHVRIPYSYWAVTTYDGDPYVKAISWRYLLRGIEYARQCGLRVNLDLHAVPGSQNGWNHSGRQGVIGWLNGTDGDLNGQRSIDIHNQLSQFFAQPRYKNVVAIYGLVNEPRMIALPLDKVLNWTQTVVQTVQKNGITQYLAFGDGFLGLPKWQGQFSGLKNMLLDAHQYVIFNTDQIAFSHQTKLNFACSGWSSQMEQSSDPKLGFGPTICGEWSQADTDCATYLNNVNVGSRWEGTMNVGDASLNVLSPKCPLKSSQCSCNQANADPSSYSPSYKAWLYDNAISSMTSFEKGWGWFYWTWRTEKSVQWSYKLGMDAGILPQKTWERSGNGPDGNPVYNCQGTAPDLSKQLPENY